MGVIKAYFFKYLSPLYLESTNQVTIGSQTYFSLKKELGKELVLVQIVRVSELLCSHCPTVVTCMGV